MKSFKEIDIIITSTLFPLDDSGLHISGEAEESKSSATSYLKSDGEELTLSYLEESEGVKIYSDITVLADTVTVKRRGGIESEFVFREGKRHTSLYKIPPYTFECEIVTKKLRNEFSASGGTITVFYDMNLGGERRRVKMKIDGYEK